MSATDHLCMLSSRAPAMAERIWSPTAARTFEDYAVRVNQTARLLHRLLDAQGLLPIGPTPAPGPPAPAPALPGYVGTQGACRDGDNKLGSYITSGGPSAAGIAFADCAAMCTTIGPRCDAYDWHELSHTSSSTTSSSSSSASSASAAAAARGGGGPPPHPPPPPRKFAGCWCCHRRRRTSVRPFSVRPFPARRPFKGAARMLKCMSSHPSSPAARCAGRWALGQCRSD
jgi:hypothetical protein